jgi:hypothetical protein
VLMYFTYLGGSGNDGYFFRAMLHIWNAHNRAS